MLLILVLYYRQFIIHYNKIYGIRSPKDEEHFLKVRVQGHEELDEKFNMIDDRQRSAT